MVERGEAGRPAHPRIALFKTDRIDDGGGYLLRQINGLGELIAGIKDIAGSYTIDEAALRSLPDDEVVALHRADALAPSTILSASLAQIERLRQLHNAQFEPAISSYSIG